MRARHWMILGISATLTFLLAAPSWADNGIDARQHRQQVRIRHGVRSGEITRPELKRLQQEQRRIEGAERRAWADGRLSRSEQYRLHRMLDRAGEHIRFARHNGPSRYSHRPQAGPWHGHPSPGRYTYRPGSSLAWSFHLW